MSMGLMIIRREASHDDVRLESTDRPDCVGQDLFPIPDAQGFIDRFRKTEVVRATEKLPAMVDPARGEQLLRANDPERFTQLRTNQILPAIAAGEREIRRLVERAVRPVGDQPSVLVIRVGRNVKDAAEHIKLLQREPDLRGIHRLRCRRGPSRKH